MGEDTVISQNGQMRVATALVVGVVGLAGTADETCASTVNIASGKPATASSWLGNDDRWEPGHVTDGEVMDVRGTTWLLSNRTAGWVRVDLEQEYFVTEVRVLNTRNHPNGDRSTKDYRMWLSDFASSSLGDYGTPTESAQFPDDRENQPPLTWHTYDYSGDPIRASYVTVSVDTWWGASGGIGEIEVDGFVPEPATLALLALGGAMVASRTGAKRRSGCSGAEVEA